MHTAHVLAAALGLLILWHPSPAGAAPAIKRPASLHAAGFVKNRGQFPNNVLFQLGDRNGAIWVTPDSLVFDAVDQGKKRVVVRQRFVNVCTDVQVEPKVPLPGLISYFRGGESDSVTGAKHYQEILLRNLWPGISVRLYLKDGGLEQEFLVSSGVDTSPIQVNFEGIDGLKIADDGSLAILTPLGSIRESRPIVYQEDGTVRRPVAAGFKLLSSSAYTFDLESYDRDRPLVIDPTLSYSSYFGGSAGDRLEGVATDGGGNIYVAGTSFSLDFPSLPGTIPLVGIRQYSEAVVAKFDPSGQQLIYSVIFGGAGSVYGNRVAVSTSGEAIVAGVASSGSFPTTANAFRQDTPCSGQFLARFNATGTALLYSTCIPGVFVGELGETGLAIDANGRAAVVGRGPNGSGFPITTPNAFQPTSSGSGSPVHGGIVDGYVAVIDTRLSGQQSLVYATFLAGRDDDIPTSAAFDASGNLYVAGMTKSADFPVTSGAYQRIHNGCVGAADRGGRCYNGFVSKFDITRSGPASLVASTLLGASENVIATGLAIDQLGNGYVVGELRGQNPNNPYVPFPITPGAAHTNPAQRTGFAAKFSSNLSILRYATYLTSTGTASPYGIAVDELGDALIVGNAQRGFTVTPDAFQSAVAGGDYDAFFLILNPSGSQVLYSTLIGGSSNDHAWGIALDRFGNPIFVGQNGTDFGGASADFPVTSTAFQRIPKGVFGERNGNWEGFIVKFDRGLSGPPVIVNVMPKEVGNSGLATLTISGTAFRTGINVHVDCPGRLGMSPDKVEIEGGGAVLFARFNFVGVNPGVCSLTLRNSDGTQTVFTPAFTVVNGGAADVRISKVGTRAVPGRTLDYFISIQNLGNVDAAGIVLEILEPWFMFSGANPTPTSMTSGEDIFPVPPTQPTHIAHLSWRYSLAPDQTRTFSYRAGLDPQVPFGVTVRGLSCDTPNEEQRDLLILLYETCKLRFRPPLPREEIERGIALCAEKVRNECSNGAAAEGTTEGPLDPNEKLVNAKTFIQTNQKLVYPIHYENIGNVEAKDVFITDVLDPNLDTSTLELLTPGATFDAKTRTVKWSLLNKNLPPKGTDNVLLSIKPRPNLPSGTAIRNKATIQFEIFPPLTTKETLNIIDNTPPQCTVQPLPIQVHSTAVPLRWTGSDAVGEIDFHSVLVSIDGGPFTTLLDRTKETSTTFNGVVGKTYRFHCKATDTVGNVEIQPNIAEAMTRIVRAGDVNADGNVTCADLAIVRASFGKRTGQPGFDPRADVNNDRIVDVRDMSFVSQKLPAGTRCP